MAVTHEIIKTNAAFEEYKQAALEVVDSMTENDVVFIFVGTETNEAGHLNGHSLLRGTPANAANIACGLIRDAISGARLTPPAAAAYLEIVRDGLNDAAASACAENLRDMSEEDREAVLADMLHGMTEMLRDALLSDDKNEEEKHDEE